jgi:NAD(P)-dependent dehydrogenase (short-subunit alcohol dehydrogenase family)
MAEERRAMVVGASRGLGLGLAVELRTRSRVVVATARDAAGSAGLEAFAARPRSGPVVENVDITDARVVDALRRRMDGQVLDLVRDDPGIVAFMSLGSVANNTVGGSELYRASKATLNSLARSFAARLGGRRITVLAMAPE